MFDPLLTKLNLAHLGREERYGKIAQLIYGNANKKGNLSDSLNRAASAYAKAGGNADQYAREFAEDVLRNAEQRDFIGIPDSSQLVSDTTKTQRFAANRELEIELQKYDDTTDLQGQKESIQAAESRIRADEELMNQKIEIDVVDEQGKLSAKTVTMRELLDEVREDEVGHKLLKACSIGTR
jgi:major membrane immunogen (membrane-anchored lipoprotein)